ncbi:7,8-didemethyl-8-hydroxy-5-deazariboflavin synthase [Egibacter rhizosphaerae]|uniref:FO synthase n=1 Tax=Egibacter rhizosphaerae TaxID=1670831 RepID=A0A411YLF9_9ACTN|nr:7,8-didemethyl-8-hydroxy-5-deazariboflavin synthase [Egibacter rhizosphaerae]
MRRALARADAGKTLSADEAAWLLTARGEALERLCATAARVRDQAFGEVVTYSRNVFVPLTHLCRDACGYCTFAHPPREGEAAFLTPEQVTEIAARGREAGCKEALFTLGDAPEERYDAARDWLAARGYETTLEYLRAVSIAVIEETGLIPHLNPGVLSWTELQTLKQVSGSMGMMLESTSPRLLEQGGAHYGARTTKTPEVRLKVLEDAGRASVPFTSGILVGIGEDEHERADALLALAATAKRYGHLQEVIVQNFRAKPRTHMADHPEPDHDELRAALAVARLLLPVKVSVQAPPNLSPGEVAGLVAAGADDLGGVSPVTIDHVNPQHAWPELDALEAEITGTGKRLVERLAVRPEYVRRPDPWLAGRMRPVVQALADEHGLARPGARPEPMPWQDPDPMDDPLGRGSGDDARWRDASAGEGVTAHARGEATLRQDAEDVYGDSAAIAASTTTARLREDDGQVVGPRTGAAPRNGGTASAEVGAILRRAEDGTPPTEAEAQVLLETSGDDLAALTRTADAVRAALVGDTVTYVVNRNINFTNICYTGCRFCAFAQRRDDPDAYELSLEQVADRAEEAQARGATEVCLQGGIHPDLGGDAYFTILDAIRARTPELHIHAFSPMEVVNGATRLGISIREWLTEARAHGLDSIPGTAAEILDDDVRWVLTKGKLPADAWIEVVTTAHELGIPSTSTMMFGHVDAPEHWAAHLHLLRRLQLEGADRPAGFTEFVPLPFVHQQAPIYLAGLARPGPTWLESLRVHAVARLVLQGAIDNVQLSWVKLGTDAAAELLRAGCNDLGGTLMEETISRMAGADHGTEQTPEQLRAIGAAAGRPVAERLTDYRLADTAHASAL